MGVIFLPISRLDNIYVFVYMYVYMYVCNHSTGGNFYSIATKFGTHVGLINIQVKFNDGLCRSPRGTRNKPIIS